MLSFFFSEQTPGNSERQGNLECCSPRGQILDNLATEQQQHSGIRKSHLGHILYTY